VPGNNTAVENTTVTTAADVTITKTDSPDPVAAGNMLTYTLSISNIGPSDATGVVVTDTLPAGVTFASASSGCGEASGTVTCTVSSLAASASSQFTVTVDVISSTNGLITNTAQIDKRHCRPQYSQQFRQRKHNRFPHCRFGREQNG